MTTHWTVRVAIAALLLIAGSACKPKPQVDPLPESEVDAFRGCERDDDCMWITNGCCDCANGGREVAIAKKQEAAFKARFDCSSMGCTESARERPCGAGTVTCQSSRCVFQPDKPQ